MTTKIPVGTPYFQDHGFGRWPEEWADVEFSVSRSGDSLKLVAPGFGELSGDYGNGAIWIQEADWLRAHPMTHPTAPKLPEGLEPVAAICDDFREIIRDIGQHIAQGQQSEAQMASMRPGYGTGVYTHIGHQMRKMLALVTTLSDAQASLRAKDAECEALRLKAARYDWLRECDWFDSELCVLRDPKRVLTRGIGLGADCPSGDRLDAAIDQAIARGKT